MVYYPLYDKKTKSILQIEPILTSKSKTMFPFKFTCKVNNDPLLYQLFSTFKATPFLPPSSSIQPLHLVAHRGEETMHLGPLSQVLKSNSLPFEVDENSDSIADNDFNSSSNFNAELGLKLLEGIFKGFKIKIAPLEAVIKNASELSLKFQDVRRRHIHHTSLGNALAKHHIDMQNGTIGGLFSGKKPVGMYIISSVIESRNFSIRLGKNGSSGISVEAPVIEKITDAGLKVDREGDKTYAISHEGDEYLVFAFSCFQLKLKEDGTISIHKEVSWIRGEFDEEKTRSIEQTEPEISFMHPDLPAILEWDRNKVLTS